MQSSRAGVRGALEECVCAGADMDWRAVSATIHDFATEVAVRVAAERPDLLAGTAGGDVAASVPRFAASGDNQPQLSQFCEHHTTPARFLCSCHLLHPPRHNRGIMFCTDLLKT